MKTEEIVLDLRCGVTGGNDWTSGLVAEAADRLEFLERALEQAVSLAKIAGHPKAVMGPVVCSHWMSLSEDKVPDLAAWLQEHNASTVPVGDGA